MRPRNIAECVDQRRHDEAEGQGDARVGDGAMAFMVDHDRPRSREYQDEGADEFGGKALGQGGIIGNLGFSVCPLRS